ncbi:restriction endonuclease Mrr [Salibacterium salarium]|nr:restriction endonuclease Mrr [Salibacterium salarium]
MRNQCPRGSFSGWYVPASPVWIITTSHFTKSAIEAAERLNIRLMNGAYVRDMLHHWKKKTG